MIASLTGKVQSIDLQGAVIEAGGVGYYFTATPETLGRLVRGEETTVLTTMVVREDAILLYGFTDDASRAMFSQLQTVSGLGPKLALACLAVAPPSELARMVSAGDNKGLQRIPGVGKRMADRMIVELKDKLNGYVEPVSDEAPAQMAMPATVSADQVVQALEGLGFTEKQATPIVAAISAENPDLGTSALLKAALAELGKK